MSHTFTYRMIQLAQVAPSRLLDALLGHRCAACDDGLSSRRAFCDPCAATVIRTVAPSAALAGAVFAAGEHGGALATAIHRLKYRNRPDLAQPLGHLLIGALPAELDVDLVVPVPLHPRRLGHRGYNQACLLARVVGFERHLPTDATALRRIRDTETQAELGRRDRLANVEGAFRGAARLAGRRVLLIDDVATTGATLRACAEAIRQAGAAAVVPAAVAITSA